MCCIKPCRLILFIDLPSQMEPEIGFEDIEMDNLDKDADNLPELLEDVIGSSSMWQDDLESDDADDDEGDAKDMDAGELTPAQRAHTAGGLTPTKSNSCKSSLWSRIDQSSHADCDGIPCAPPAKQSKQKVWTCQICNCKSQASRM